MSEWELISPQAREELEKILASSLTEPELAILLSRLDPAVRIDRVARGENLEVKIFDVVDDAIRHRWLDKLVAKAADELPHVPELGIIANEIISRRDEPVMIALRGALQRIIVEEGIHDTVIEGYRWFMPEYLAYGLDLASPANETQARVFQLSAHGGVKGSAPLVEFLTFLARVHSGSTQTTLLDLLQTAYNNKTTFPDLDRRLVEARVDAVLKRMREFDIHVLISVEPIGDQYRISTWTQKVGASGSFEACVKAEDPFLCLQENLSREIARRFRGLKIKWHLEGEGNLPSKTVLELFLPRHLLRSPVDQWLARPDKSVPMGYDDRVVLRSRERTYSWNFEERVAWEKFWELHKSAEGKALRCSPEEVLNDGVFQATVDMGNHCAVALTFAPRDGVIGEGILERIIGRGTPIVLWPRTQPEKPYHQFVAGLLAEPRPDWRESVWMARRGAETNKSATEFGRHLALLWDDYDRRPPDEPEEPQFDDPEALWQ
ncbi:MAG: effector-associated domain EAD1-containing protein [Acidobacteriota bacterium]